MSVEESERTILAERARALARPHAEFRHEVEKYAVFERSGVRYALAPSYVFAVAHVMAPTPLPGAAPYWAGVSSMRGELLALVDLAILLESSDAPIHSDADAAADVENDSRLVLVLGTERRELGLVIDAVLEAAALSADVASAPPGDAAAQLVLGTTADGTRILRGDALLADPRLFIQANHFTES